MHIPQKARKEETSDREMVDNHEEIKWCNWRCSEKSRKYRGWSKINTLLPALLLSSAPWHYCNTNYFTPLHYIGTANTHTNTNTDANTNTNTHINKNKHSFCFLALALLEHHLLHSSPLYCNNSNHCSLCHCTLLIAVYPTSVQLLLWNGDGGNDDDDEEEHLKGSE